MPFKLPQHIKSNLIKYVQRVNEQDSVKGNFEMHIMYLQMDLCPNCGEMVEGFTDQQAFHYYMDSGMCESCQNSMWESIANQVMDELSDDNDN
jgi:hypothetical protein